MAGCCLSPSHRYGVVPSDPALSIPVMMEENVDEDWGVSEMQ